MYLVAPVIAILLPAFPWLHNKCVFITDSTCQEHSQGTLDGLDEPPFQKQNFFLKLSITPNLTVVELSSSYLHTVALLRLVSHCINAGSLMNPVLKYIINCTCDAWWKWRRTVGSIG